MRNKKISYLVIILIFTFLIKEHTNGVQAQETKSARDRILQQARQHFQEGERFYNQRDYYTADEEFKKAQDLLESLGEGRIIIKDRIIQEKVREERTEAKKMQEYNTIDYKALDIDVFHYNDYLKMALGFARNGDSRRAIANYLKAINLAPKSAHLHYNLAIEYLKIKQFSLASEEFKRVIQLNPKDKDAYYNLGILYEGYLGDYKLARFYYTRYIKLAPRAADTGEVKTWIRQINKEMKLKR